MVSRRPAGRGDPGKPPGAGRPEEREKPWFRRAGPLVEELRGCHRGDVPVPQVAGYRDLVPLDGGGQGTVFLATQEADGKRIALKVFHARAFDSPVARRRFEREITLASRLVHPNVVRLHRHGHTLDGRPFLAMEFVGGLPLDEWMEERSSTEIVELVRQLCSALDHAHRRGVIHRDLKPGNVRVDEDDNARLLDFGLAKPAVGTSAVVDAPLSMTGEFLGSLAWASPEQVAGHADDVDTRTDVHALGLLLYRGLIGEMPYDVSGSVAQVVENIRHAPPRRFPRRAGGAGGDLETIVLRCLAKDPERRYASVADLARDLDHYLDDEPIEARRDGLRFLLTSLVRAHPGATGAAGLALVALTGFAIVVSALYARATDAERTAVEALADKRHETERVEAVNEFLLSAFLPGAPAGVDPRELAIGPLVTAAAGRVEIDPKLTDRPLVRADLHVALAYWYSSLPDGRDDAAAHADAAWRIYEQSGALVSTQAAWTAEVRGNLRLQAGDFAGARRELIRALETYRVACSDEMNVARVQGGIASCAFALDDLDGLEPRLLECREIVARQLGAEHPQIASVDQALAHLRQRLAER